MLIVAILFLILNIKGYKNLFKSSESINNNAKKKFDELKSESERQTAKGVIIISMIVALSLLLIYYVISGVMMTDILYMALLASLFGVNAINSFFKSIKLLNFEYKYNLYSRLLVPIGTFYHIYFIIFLLVIT
jgi:hypothetical protein